MKKFSVMLIAFLCATFLGNFSQKVKADEPEFQAVNYTSPITLQWLAKAGIPEAVEFIGNLSADAIIKPEGFKDYARVEKANSIYQELRYTSINDFIESQGYTTVVDLGCGVSPRGIYMARKGIKYIGVELEPVVQVLEEYTPMFLTEAEQKNIHFAVADVTDRDAMLKAVENAPGKVCIVMDNLSLYISLERQKAMLENIHEILKIHGGCFVTSDHLADEILMGATSAVYGKKNAAEIFDNTVKLYENTSEMNFSDTFFDTPKEAMEFHKENGFNVEERPLFSKTPALYSLKSLNDKQTKNILNFTKKKMLWVMTAK